MQSWLWHTFMDASPQKKGQTVFQYQNILYTIIRHLHFTEHVSIADENSHFFLTDPESKLVAIYTNFNITFFVVCVTNFPSLILFFHVLLPVVIWCDNVGDI